MTDHPEEGPAPAATGDGPTNEPYQQDHSHGGTEKQPFPGGTSPAPRLALRPRDAAKALGLTMTDLMPDRPGAPRRATARHTAAPKVFATAHKAVAELGRRHGPAGDFLWTEDDVRRACWVLLKRDLDEMAGGQEASHG